MSQHISCEPTKYSTADRCKWNGHKFTYVSITLLPCDSGREGINICHYVLNTSFFANGFFLEVNYLLVAFDIDLTWEKTAHHILMIFCFFSRSILQRSTAIKKD